MIKSVKYKVNGKIHHQLATHEFSQLPDNIWGGITNQLGTQIDTQVLGPIFNQLVNETKDA